MRIQANQGDILWDSDSCSYEISHRGNEVMSVDADDGRGRVCRCIGGVELMD